MPLGKLSKIQIAKGFEVLEEIQEALKEKKKKATLNDLSSRFYTVFPHNFGRARPTVIDNEDLLQQKFDMLAVCVDLICILYNCQQYISNHLLLMLGLSML